jgi:hypothetical protein
MTDFVPAATKNVCRKMFNKTNLTKAAMINTECHQRRRHHGIGLAFILLLEAIMK